MILSCVYYILKITVKFIYPRFQYGLRELKFSPFVLYAKEKSPFGLCPLAVELENLTYPDGYSKPAEPQISVFETWIWHNQEVCNECFTQVRDIGEEITINNPINTLTVNAYYERTDNGIQAHTAFEKSSDRFGTCFCKECGADTYSLGYTKSLDELKEDAKRIVKYVNTGDEPPYSIDGQIMGTTLKDLKTVPENTGFDTEILAVATIEGIFNHKT